MKCLPSKRLSPNEPRGTEPGVRGDRTGQGVGRSEGKNTRVGPSPGLRPTSHK